MAVERVLEDIDDGRKGKAWRIILYIF